MLKIECKCKFAKTGLTMWQIVHKPHKHKIMCTDTDSQNKIVVLTTTLLAVTQIIWSQMLWKLVDIF